MIKCQGRGAGFEELCNSHNTGAPIKENTIINILLNLGLL
jgi:hypothetical protein